MPTNPTFVAKGRDFKVVVQHATPHHHPNGNTTYEGDKYAEFNNGTFTLDERAVKRIGLPRDVILTRLREATSYGEFFYEMGKEPGAPKNPMDQMLEKVGAAAAKQDVKRLQALLAEEEQGDNRELVTGQIRIALGALGDTEQGRRPPGKPKASAQVAGQE